MRKARVSARSNRRRWDHQPAGDHPRLGPPDRPALSQCDRLAMPADRGAVFRRSKKSRSPGKSGRRPAWWWTPIFPGRSWSGFWRMRRGLAGRPKRGRRFSARSTPGLAYRLSGKKLQVTDYSNASRTMLFNIHKLSWDREILNFFSIPEKMLPAAMPSSGIFGLTSADGILGSGGSDRRDHGGSARRALRPNLFPRGAIKKHLRDRMLPAHEHGGKARAFEKQSAHHHRLGNRVQGGIRPGREHLHRRGRDPMAARRSEDSFPGFGKRRPGEKPPLE